MKGRCLRPTSADFKNYGGRGIKICDRWVNSFEAFYADMGDCPEGHSIERIDNDGNYEPSNCRWTDRRSQNKNRRNSLPIDLKAIAAERGISYKYAWALYKKGRLQCYVK